MTWATKNFISVCQRMLCLAVGQGWHSCLIMNDKIRQIALVDLEILEKRYITLIKHGTVFHFVCWNMYQAVW